VWDKTPHGHAMDASEKVAVSRKNRQFDGDCVVCHTVRLRTQKRLRGREKTTAHLKHVGLRDLPRSGSGHAANPERQETAGEPRLLED